ncbi:putative serine threonine protein kinase [Phaeomoniella chlamydospora]|uniref:Putative serine threonine protein kinase n=1 Tax=Phaeomoniella chlamydospora TaxID=158046 RepID=A0A0G2ESL6_PHACM|nr:putative serine threonine protein kinase [Phaeomoniella chlamydospora]
MPPTRSKAELEQSKKKLANSYNELLQEFSAKDLRRVGNYTLDRLIGKGSFGKVYLARHNLTNGSKVVTMHAASRTHIERQSGRAKILEKRRFESRSGDTPPPAVPPSPYRDELYNYLLAKGALPVEKVQKIFTQLVGGVSYIHNRLCVHRDLKLENILLDKHENVKLIDFGFTREYEGNASYLQTFCGTICYSAPEMLKGEKYAAQKVDVWSLGIILYALLTGELPFDEDDDQATKAKILKEEPKYPDNFPQQAKKLCSKMLAKRPFHRPTLADILADPFLAEYAPQQQAVLKLTQPAPFTTTLEKSTLERMKSAGVNIDQIIESVLAQRCDNLAGWWALLIEKEERKEARRERKRKEREAELKATRRTSAASSRLLAPTLAEVSEEQPLSPAKSSNDDELKPRGRRDRRNTPQMAAPDLPKLPEGTAIDSPTSITPPVPLDKDSPHGAAEPLKPSPFLSDVSPVPASPPGGLVYARRKKSPFRGPTINTSFPPLGVSNGLGTPGLKGRHDSTTVLSTLDSGSVGNRRVNQRDLPTTTEEEEEEEDIEEVDAFSPVIIKRGESIHTITMLDDRGNPTENTADPDENVLANEEPNALNANAPTLETTSGPTEAK